MHGGDDFRIIPPLAHSVPDLKSESESVDRRSQFAGVLEG